MAVNKQQIYSDTDKWKHLVLLSILVSYFFVLMEWVFFVTKSSFMDGMGNLQKVGVLFITGGTLTIFSLLAILLLMLIGLLLTAVPGSSRYILYIASLIPALLLSVLSLLLLDNFTYTVFKFGIVSSRGIFRAIYVIVLLGLLFYFYRWVLNFISTHKKQPFFFRLLFVFSFLLLLITAGFVLGRSKYLPSQPIGTGNGSRGRLPNILILGSDGINASNMSVYGYERDTTPFLAATVSKSLFAENAFTNAGNSMGSVTSLLTGKLPTQTRVIYSPNILMGTNVYQHLPGILQRLGYYTAEIGVLKYVDAYDVNMQDSFDLVNQRSIDNGMFFRMGRRLGLGDAFYFLSRISERVSDRLLHIFYIRTMSNSYKLVTDTSAQVANTDQEKVDQIIDLFAKTNDPLFIHVHLMGTHGSKFFPAHRVFSANEEQNSTWMDDFYDDAILDFDSYIEEVFNALSASGKLENTIVVIYTDHNQRYHTTQRIPLIFYFPGGEHAGRIQNNTQNLDIAPTLLDYIGVPIPSWMTGQSLLMGEPPKDRPIFSAISGEPDPEKYRPPYYQFGIFAAVVCDQWYAFYAESNLLVTSSVDGHTAPCNQENVFTPKVMSAKILDLLQEAGFDVKTIPVEAQAAMPNGDVSRAQASVFILKTLHGFSYTPPPAKGIFSDVPVSSQYAPWVEEIFQEGIDKGCSASPVKFCPDERLTRADVAKLLLTAKNGRDYTPPAPTGVFVDVPVSSKFSSWVEEFYNRGITAACIPNPRSFCPENKIDMQQFSRLLHLVFGEA